MHYRGTPDAPGVVLGLARGGSCIGMAFKLHHATRRHAIEQLYVREMSDHVYVPTLVGVTLRDGQRVRALTFAANRSSGAFQDLHEDEILRRLAVCSGRRGPNREYAINTWHSPRARRARRAPCPPGAGAAVGRAGLRGRARATSRTATSGP
jgi:cation transport protein ChaC